MPPPSASPAREGRKRTGARTATCPNELNPEAPVLCWDRVVRHVRSRGLEIGGSRLDPPCQPDFSRVAARAPDMSDRGEVEAPRTGSVLPLPVRDTRSLFDPAGPSTSRVEKVGLAVRSLETWSKL